MDKIYNIGFQHIITCLQLGSIINLSDTLKSQLDLSPKAWSSLIILGSMKQVHDCKIDQKARSCVRYFCLIIKKGKIVNGFSIKSCLLSIYFLRFYLLTRLNNFVI